MNLSKETTKKILLIILFAGLLFGCLSHISMIGNLFKGILGIAKPFILGLCFAFIMNVLLRPIERLWDKYLGSKGGRNIKRLVCLLSSTLIIIGSVFILFFIIVPEVHQTSRMIVDMFPQYKIQLEQWWLEISIFFSRYNITLPQLEFDLSEIKQLVENYLVESGHSFIGRTFDFTKSVFTGVFNVVLGFVFSFYVLAQKEKLGGQGKKLLTAYCSPKVANKTLEIFSLTSRVFTNFTTGQFTEALIIGVLCFIGMIYSVCLMHRLFLF